GRAANARYLPGAAAPHAVAPAREEPGLLADDTLAAAARAGDEAGVAPLGARTRARRAVFGPLEHQYLLAPQRRLLEVELQRLAKVAPRRRPPALQPEQIAEQRIE